jgi:hypothetical protein
MEPEQPESDDFSLVVGGPLYQLLLKTKLARHPLDLVHRRMLVITLIAWLPLLVLSVIDGNLLGGVRVPFLFDIEAHARFLIAMPILIMAELLVHQRLATIIPQFRELDLVPTQSMPMFEAAIVSARRLRNSVPAEIAILVIVFIVIPWVRPFTLAQQTATWYASDKGGHIVFTWAGLWFNHISAPMFLFLLLRWYFRTLVWWRFLWEVSRLPLDLRPAHPDLAGGLDFLGASVICFAPLLFAQGTLSSGGIASRILFAGHQLTEFSAEIVMLVIFLVAMIAFPLTFFTPRLIATRFEGMRAYGALGSRYVREFERKWIESPSAGERLVGSTDIRSLADLGNSFNIVREMKPIPLDMRMVYRLALSTAAPFFPLLLTVLPLNELIDHLLKMIL